jgi:hypothetical protein
MSVLLNALKKMRGYKDLKYHALCTCPIKCASKGPGDRCNRKQQIEIDADCFPFFKMTPQHRAKCDFSVLYPELHQPSGQQDGMANESKSSSSINVDDDDDDDDDSNDN